MRVAAAWKESGWVFIFIFNLGIGACLLKLVQAESRARGCIEGRNEPNRAEAGDAVWGNAANGPW
jgi:hypothetical protein